MSDSWRLTQGSVPGERAESSRARTRTFVVLVMALLLVGGVLLRLPTFSRPLLSDDEAIYATTADALARGGLLYRDVVDHKPPLIYHVYQAGFAALGSYNTHGAHALVILSVLLTAGLLMAIRWSERTVDMGTLGGFPCPPAMVRGRQSRPAPHATGLVAAGLFLLFSTTWHDYDTLAANCELFLLAPQTAAAWLLLRDLRQPAAGLAGFATHLTVGVLVGTSALFKYQGLTFLLASVGVLGWSAIIERASWSWTATRAVAHLAGAVLPAALYLLGCVVAGNAADAVYWFTFNFAYVGAGLSGVTALARGLRRAGMIGGVALLPYALGLWAAVTTTAAMVRVLRRRVRGSAPALDAGAARAIDTDMPTCAAVLGVLWLATSAIALAAGGRFFGHYFHLVLAPLCLLAAPEFCRLWSRGRAYRGLLVALCALPALFFFWLATLGRPFAAAWDEGAEPAYGEVAARIAALTTPDDRVFVWGNSPQLYALARRPMGARFSFCNYMTGESPGTPTQTGRWDADANQLPAAWDMLFADLEQRRPTLFVDAAAAGWDGYGKFPIARYPRLRAFVDRHYQPTEVRAGVVLYRRLP